MDNSDNESFITYGIRFLLLDKIEKRKLETKNKGRIFRGRVLNEYDCWL